MSLKALYTCIKHNKQANLYLSLDHLYFYLFLGLFRERKRSKSKSKIDSRSLKLQETIAPSQIAMSNFSVTNEGRNAQITRSRSPTTSKYTHQTDK